MSDIEDLEELVGKTVLTILWSEDILIFLTDTGSTGFTVDGDCCSTSYFYDFYGVVHLLRNGPIVKVQSVALPCDDTTKASLTECYGYQLFTNRRIWGEVTSVFSFRNDSNGYYGGSMRSLNVKDSLSSNLLKITTDQVGS